jgi:immune inhibitor A
VTFDVQDWKTTAGDEAYYANGESGLRGSDTMQEMFRPMLDELASSGYDFMSLDSDSWGDLDQFFVIHSGYPAEFGDPSDGCTNPASNRIWSQGHSVSTAGWSSPDGAYTVNSYGMTGAFGEGLCKGNAMEMGVIVHEMMHLFGLPEMYDEDFEETPIPLGGLGKFSIMSNAYGWYVGIVICFPQSQTPTHCLFLMTAIGTVI